VEQVAKDSVAHPALGSHVQVYDVVEVADPIRIGGGDVPDAVDGEVAGVMSGGAGRIRKRFLPEFDGGCRGTELDAGEQVGSCSLNPRFGDDATRFERRRFVV
jgi:hypothetical protein